MKSKSGIVKNKIIGLKIQLKIWLPELFQVNKILMNPRRNPIKRLPESPRYNFAGGKLKIKNPNIVKSNITEISVSLFCAKI